MGSDGDSDGKDDSDSAGGSDDDDDGDDNDNDIQSSINNISFGALAKAQSSLPKKQKQRASTTHKDDDDTEKPSPLDDIRARIHEAREQKRQAQASKPTKSDKSNSSQHDKRTSKHAPMVQSSKHAVTRRRTVIEPPAMPRTRDPRFDPTVVGKHGRMDAASSDSAYGFLNEYRASELRSLKEQLKNTKNAAQKEELKRAVRSATDRMREVENRKREQKILAEHKKGEKEAIREGKKSTPYYMKKSDLKKEVLLRKYNDMNSKDRAKALERRRKKMSSKERLQMPAERRGFDTGPPPEEGGARKRKRTV